MKKNEYGLFTAIAMIVGIVIGSGIFFKSDNILVATGGSVALGVLVFCIAAIAIIFGSLTISQLASRSSKEGGLIAYAEEYYNKSTSCAFGWFQTFLYFPTLIAVVSWVAGIYICILFGIEGTLEKQMLIGLAIMVFLFVINTLSAKLGGLFQNASTIIKLIPLLLIAVAGLVFGDTSSVSFSDITAMKSTGWIAAIAPIAFSFDGWVVSTSISHEIKDSKRNLPKALIIAPIFILIVYVLYFVGISMYIGPETIMSLGDAHVDLAANNLLGPWGAKIVLIFVIISIMGTINGLTLGMIRLPHSLSVRNMFPKSKVINKIDEKLLMPVNSAIVAFIIAIVWYIAHYLTTKFGLLPNSDISEISITMSYTMYILLYVKVIQLGRQGKISGIWNTIINPVLAIIGSLIILFGSMGNQLFWIYAAFCLLVMLLAVLFCKKNEKIINGCLE
ncbi:MULTISPECIES: APC family permease [Clostridium]|jgi:APA family basic amino acid/polyamine antiporter|uniref:Amino acid permease n=1 Tax=Clostridium disporicum TaxID=84024 RepID=A0A174H1N8_9CLOT|nr:MULTISPECIES: APC family permease [Clostridium]MBX9185549.1 APC family permease [Clostridium sp. K04]MDU3521925.1 APC family permease [Clostridium saudiense]CUO68743.1 amino acid permease [Clostridium disporicum]CUP00837.1 amino acid permease [Clostridium disporicum]SCJ86670.1 Serine/threonine exchanger SteT [uncultured Clostridium sp.]